MPALRVILGDQLSESISSLNQCDRGNDIILMAEVMTEASYVKHHKAKLTFVFSAMRHFAQQLKSQGFQVCYVELEDKGNTGDLVSECQRWFSHYQLEQVIMTEPSEYRLLEAFETLAASNTIPITLLPDDRFLASKQDFVEFADGRKQLRMEFFYRQMRARYGVLMEGSKPTGGKWNYDIDNRHAMPDSIQPSAPLVFPADEVTTKIQDMVSRLFADNVGEHENWRFAVTRQQALDVLEHFVEERLPQFGTYQDAMRGGDPWLFHSHIGLYLNSGLLLPKEVIERAENAYANGLVPLNAAEGFIRQILGWREYVRGLYWLKMPDYKSMNALDAQVPLPSFFWNGDTHMNCLKQCVNDTMQYAYAHHIQRLMVLGNFSLLAGLSPEQVNEWFLLVYADAYEWVELPNVSGMVLYADGGVLASKPYAASGAYINKMSDYCKTCHYKVKQKNGEDACPFNYLYWDFLRRNQEKLRGNHRLGMPYRTLNNMSDEKIIAISNDSERFFTALENNEKV